MNMTKKKTAKIISGIMALALVCTTNAAPLSGVELLSVDSMLAGNDAVGTVAASLLGDSNVDGSVTLADIISLKKYVVNAGTLTDTGKANSDVNSDGKINSLDVASLKAQILATTPVTDVTYIYLQGSAITVNGSGATVSGSDVTITSSGNYVVSGTLNDGQIFVQTADTDTENVSITLNGANINCSDDAPFYVVNADKTVVTLAAGTTNTITDGATYNTTTEATAAVYAKDDLTINGTGSLTVTGNYTDGIFCNNDLKINGGVITVNAVGDAVNGKASAEFKSGTVYAQSSGDGIKSSQGTLTISGGYMQIKAGNDAVQGVGVEISGGEVYANGDRGITSESTAANITGGTVFATATDAVTTTYTATQGTMMLSYAAQQTKDSTISVKNGTTSVLDLTSQKKYQYVLISSANLATGTTYNVYNSNVQMCHAGSTTGAFAITSSITSFTGVTAMSTSGTVSEAYGTYDINLNNTTITSTAKTVAIDDTNDTATITVPGTYNVYGTLNDGQIIVDVDKTVYANSDTDQVKLILNGVTMTCLDNAPIYIAEIEDKCIINLADGTTNTITDGSTRTDTTIDAAIYAADDLNITGSGTLKVTANYADGIASKNDINIKNGIVNVTSKDDGIRGKDSVEISGGSVTVNSTADGIKSTNFEDAGSGIVTISSGTVNITAGGDGIQAEQAVNISGGTIGIKCTATSSTTTTDASAKGIKASLDDTSTLSITEAFNISGGTITITSNDDTIHSNGNGNITGGTMTLSSGDDGIHADNILTLGTSGGADSDFTVNITKSYEGVEGYDIEVYSGTVLLVSSDDGFNAAGGSDSSGSTTTQPGGWGQGGMSTSTGVLNFHGGYVYTRANGDNIDSNGNITMTGGTVLACGPTSGGNGIFDYGDSGCSFTQTGGTIFGIGTSDMAVYPSCSYVSATGTLSANSLIAIADSSGNALAVLKVPSDMNMSGLVEFSNASASTSTYSIYSGATYNGTLNAQGYGVGGTISGGTKLTGSSSGGGQPTNPWG